MVAASVLAACSISRVAAAQIAPPDARHAWRPSTESYGPAFEYDYDGGPLPPHGRLELRRHEALFQAGAFTALGAYMASTFVAEIGDLACNGQCTDQTYDLLYLPVAGPIIAAALPGVQDKEDAGLFTGLLIADAALQFGGLLTALVGHFWRTRVVVVNVFPDSAWRLAPGVSGAPLGLTLTWTGL